MIEYAIHGAYAQAFAVLLKRWEQFDLVEDCLQDACIRALKDWPQNGIPDSPKAWLVQVSHRLAIDHFRRRQRWDKLTPLLAHELELQQFTAKDALLNDANKQDYAGDEFLRLIFTCCHPAILQSDQVALSLKILLGFSVSEIAKALLQKNKTIEQRLNRAKKKIAVQNVPFEIPNETEIEPRTASVLSVIYLIFNEGYCSNSNDQPLRKDLCLQAITLVQSLAQQQPNNPEVLGLLALMLGHKAREEARLTPCGEWITLEDQDRSMWDTKTIKLADDYLTRALRIGSPHSYQLQAAIIAVHNQAKNFAETDWTQILLLYNLLTDLLPSPIVKLNRCVALWYASNDTDSALAELEVLLAHHSTLKEYGAFHITRAHMLKAKHKNQDAKDAFEYALGLSSNSAERKSLIRHINRL